MRESEDREVAIRAFLADGVLEKIPVTEKILVCFYFFLLPTFISAIGVISPKFVNF
jgi:hypothetical protein